MRNSNLSCLLCVAIASLAVLPGTALAQHDHAAHAHVTAPAPPATPWTADATLSANMLRIHAALEALRHGKARPADAVFAKDRAIAIEHAAAEIFAKCKLTPEKDAVLHGMLVPLLTATSRFKADPDDAASLQAMRHAVAAYPRYFSAPGWAAEASSSH